MKYKKNTLKIAVGLTIAVLLVFIIFYVLNVIKTFEKSDRIAPSIFVGSLELGGLKKEEAKEKLLNYCYNKIHRNVAIKVSDKIIQKEYSQLGLFYDWQTTLDNIYSKGRKGSIIERFYYINGYKKAKIIGIDKKIDKSVIRRCLLKLANENNSLPLNARIIKNGSSLSVIPEKEGRIIDISKNVDLIYDTVNSRKSEVELVYKSVSPRLKASDLSMIDTKLSSYTTRYNAAKKERSYNISLAAKNIDGKIVMPGETFSYNETVGPRTAKAGFKNAPIIQDGILVEGMGGGICQVSTNIFNAALISGLKIKSRRNHSLRVKYVPFGRDAMVNYGTQDFKFVNNNSNPVIVFARAAGGILNVQIWGNSADKKKCIISTNGINTSRTVINPDGTRFIDYTTQSIYLEPKVIDKPKPPVIAEDSDKNNNNSSI